jgi:class 3 adenylate cyclase
MGSSTDARAQDSRLEERTLVLVLIDLAGFTRAVAGLSAVEIAELLDRFYALSGEIVGEHGGRVVKFSGDNCLAAFEPDHVVDALACVQALRTAVVSMGQDVGVDLDTGANVHLAKVVIGAFGAPYASGDDVMGAGVIHVFRMGAGPGVRISEPVYRKLPSGERTSWRKHQPPATYTLES